MISIKKTGNKKDSKKQLNNTAELATVKAELEETKAAKAELEKEVVDASVATYKYAKLTVVSSTLTAISAAINILAIVYFSGCLAKLTPIKIMLFDNTMPCNCFGLALGVSIAACIINIVHLTLLLFSMPKHKNNKK